MSIEILMPALSPTMTEGNLVKWLKKEGDHVKAGQILCEIETDKATMEVEAVDEGILGKIIIEEGAENVQVNSLIAILLEDGEDVASLPTSTIPLKKEDPVSLKEETLSSVPLNVSLNTSDDASRIFASPLAKRIAEQKKIDLSNMKGTGPNGRIIKADVERGGHEIKAIPVQQESSSYQDVKVNLMRKTVAKRLTESKNTVPHFYLTIDCEIDNLLDMRQQINKAQDVKISVNDILIKACAKTLMDVPSSNVTWHDSYMRYYRSADISVAVAIDGGLVTPIIFSAEKQSLVDISKNMKVLADKARQGKLQPPEYEGGSFTLSNLGMFGVKQFGAIINPPQGCILAVGAGEKRVVVKNDHPTVATVMTVTLSVDHRSVDGALGAQFLSIFKQYIENPISIIV